MKDLFTILKQEILIVYHDINWRYTMRDEIIDSYPDGMVCRIYDSINKCSIEFIDGTIITFISDKCSIETLNADKVIIQPGADESCVNTFLENGVKVYMAIIEEATYYIPSYRELRKI